MQLYNSFKIHDTFYWGFIVMIVANSVQVTQTTCYLGILTPVYRITSIFVVTFSEIICSGECAGN